MKTTNKITRKSAYVYLDDDEEKALDIIVEDGNYKSKTELLTTAIRYLIHKDTISAPEHIQHALADEVDAVAALEKLKGELFSILDEYARPVLANRGTEIGYQLLRDDIQKTLYERTKKVPDEHLLHSWTQRYCAIHHADFVLLRLDTSTRKYEESCGLDSDNANI